MKRICLGVQSTVGIKDLQEYIKCFTGSGLSSTWFSTAHPRGESVPDLNDSYLKEADKWSFKTPERYGSIKSAYSRSVSGGTERNVGSGSWSFKSLKFTPENGGTERNLMTHSRGGRKLCQEQTLSTIDTTSDAAPEWEMADKCSECGSKFSIFCRRHHCRRCGRSVCDGCAPASNLVAIPEWGYDHPVRHCAGCYSDLTEAQASGTTKLPTCSWVGMAIPFGMMLILPLVLCICWVCVLSMRHHRVTLIWLKLHCTSYLSETLEI
uniref:FYVE-type domain-containing protein n=1 Tax=Fibrocapsa japonica TaxID=94617 RepID=A0A7S2V5K6_9STRA